LTDFKVDFQSCTGCSHPVNDQAKRHNFVDAFSSYSVRSLANPGAAQGTRSLRGGMSTFRFDLLI
jgi:hypothetical protein